MIAVAHAAVVKTKMQVIYKLLYNV